jgi:hypothetical protein
MEGVSVENEKGRIMSEKTDKTEILASSDLVQRQNEVLRGILETPCEGQYGGEMSDLDAQRLANARSDQRCPRCGTLTYALVPALPLSMLCAPCMGTLRAMDEAFDPALLWFSQIIPTR